MQAWAAAGKNIGRVTTQQAARATPISASQLMPGDLIFWGSVPSGVYHVGLYLGGGEMIHAPRAGQPVKVENIYYWRTPSGFGRP